MEIGFVCISRGRRRRGVVIFESTWIRCGIKFTELMDSHVFYTSNALLKQFMTGCEMCWKFGVRTGKFWKARTTNAYKARTTSAYHLINDLKKGRVDPMTCDRMIVRVVKARLRSRQGQTTGCCCASKLVKFIFGSLRVWQWWFFCIAASAADVARFKYALLCYCFFPLGPLQREQR